MGDSGRRATLGQLLEGIPWTARHLVDRIAERRRRRNWSTRTEPFEHRVAEQCVFTLYPDQYIDGEIYALGAYERQFIDLIRTTVKGQDLVALDVGANIGNHALHLSGTFSEIHCFEPNPETLERLRSNISSSGVGDKVTVHPVGLSDEDAELPFAANDEGDLGSSYFSRDDAAANSITLPVRRGSDYLDDHGISRVDFIKLDVENHEIEVLRGLSRVIARDRPLIVFEYHGGRAEVPAFDLLAATMPGYVFAEACHAPADASRLQKLAWHLLHRGRPELRSFTQPEPRTYENVVAFPDAAYYERVDDLASVGARARSSVEER